MLRFFTRLFAVVGLFFVLLIAGGILAILQYSDHPAPEPASVILTLDFDQPITEGGNVSPLHLALHKEETPFLDMLRAIDKAKTDPHVKGIVAHFGSMQPNLAEAQDIRAAIKSFRASGKATYAFGPGYGEFGEGNRAYFLASAFENIWLQPVGTVSLTGLEMESPFAKTALDKIGVKADFMQREEYKSFMDMATRDDFAPPVKENMQSLLNDLAAQIADGIADSRGFDSAHIRDLMARGPYTDDEALKEKLVTRLGYFDELNDELDTKFGKDAESADVATYLGYDGIDKQPFNATKIALIYGKGEIIDHKAPSLTGEKGMGADAIADAFDDAADDANVKAILFRVDSPGGSPSASETIRRAMIHAQKKGKPVFVSMGELAASGGYWVAMNADHIVAEPGTLTGSIGVLAGKFTIADLLQKLGITFGNLKTSDNAGMWSMAEGFSPQQRERMNALLDNTYRAFTKNVAEARHIAPEKMPDIAKGRVWTGAQAVQLGLVDELGGVDTTLGAIRKKLNLQDNAPLKLKLFPKPENPIEEMLRLMRDFGVEEAALRPLLTSSARLRGFTASLTNPQMLQAPIAHESIR